jgi:hypothetical protein
LFGHPGSDADQRRRLCCSRRTAGKAVDEAVTEASASEEASQQAEENRNALREVTPSKAFTIGSRKVLDGWKVKADTILGDAEFNVTGKAKNVSEATSTPNSSASPVKCWAMWNAAPATWSLAKPRRQAASPTVNTPRSTTS